MPIRSHGISQSESYLERALRVIPGASQTFSKGYDQFVQGVSPSFLAKGKGSHVWDVDGNEYIDFVTGLGPIVLGYDDPDVTAAVVQQAHDGSILSLPHPLEVEVAEMLVDLIPCAEMVRFGKNGSDVTSAAVRAARALTGRDKVAFCGYHGWQDWYIGATTRNRGVPLQVRELAMSFSYNDIASLERLFSAHPNQIACVILEPVGVVPPVAGFLERVAEVTRKNGALLVFDEVLTGFRLAIGGAQQYFGVIPDLACFAKAMANGYPISAIAGRREYMSVFEEIFFSFTFGGDTLSLAAAKATMTKMQTQPVIPHLWRQGTAMQDGYNTLAAELGLHKVTRNIGLAPRTVCTFTGPDGQDSLLLRSLFQQELAKRGVLFLVGFSISYSLTDADVAQALDACRESLEVVARAVQSGTPESFLEGLPARPVFRRA